MLNIYLKKDGEKTVNPSLRIYVNKKENRPPFKTKTGYYLELLTHETMKLLEVLKVRLLKMKMVKMCPI